MRDDDYYTIRTDRLDDVALPSRPSPLRAAILFSSAVIAVTVMVVPELTERRSQHVAGLSGAEMAAERGWFGRGSAPLGLDPTATGSLRPAGGLRAVAGAPSGVPGWRMRGGPERVRGSSYVVRRSVLTNGSVCVIRDDGSRNGAC